MTGTGPFQVEPAAAVRPADRRRPLNNLQPGQSHFGAADLFFPRMLTPYFRRAEQRAPFGPPGPSAYFQNGGSIVDSQPRIISNLIVDQTGNNPAAVAVAGEPAEPCAATDEADSQTCPSFFIPNVAPDVGLSAPFNSMFTFFGQFFDHGLDLVNKGGAARCSCRCSRTTRCSSPGSPTNFMVLTRADRRRRSRAPTASLGTADDIQEATNQTTPFVDQNQTYTSHPSHQVFLREYELNGDAATRRDRPHDRRRRRHGGIGNWARGQGPGRDDARHRARRHRRRFNVPLLATDPYGRFLPRPERLPAAGA